MGLKSSPKSERENTPPSLQIHNTACRQDTMSLLDIDLLTDEPFDERDIPTMRNCDEADHEQVAHIERTLTEESAGNILIGQYKLYNVGKLFYGQS